MINVEIVRGVEDPGTNQLRYDVKVEIPGIYTETIPYGERVSDVADPAEAQRVMDSARAHAKDQMLAFLDRLAIAHAARCQALGGGISTPAPKRRPGRPKKAPGEALAFGIDVEALKKRLEVPSDLEVQEHEMKRATTALRESMETVGGEPMDRKPEHEAILRQMLVEAYGSEWHTRPEVKSAAMAMATEAIATQVLVRDPNGQAHPQIRALFAERVRMKCPV